MKRKPSKPYWEMTTRELAEATKEFDREFIGDTARPMNATERERWERLKRKHAGQTHNKKIAVTVEGSLLKRSDDLARKLGVSRNALIRRALKMVLATETS